MRIGTAVGSCIALAACTSPAPPSSSALASARTPLAKSATDPNRIICEDEEETGSLIAKQRVCMTAAQWREKSYSSGQWTERQSTYNTAPNGGDPRM